MTNTYTKLLETHRANLDDHDIQVLEDLSRRHTLAQTIAWPENGETTDDMAGFAKLERVFTQTPVALWGQEVPSLAHSQLTVWKSKRDENGDLVAGQKLLSVLMSEQAVTKMVLNSNRGSSTIPLTTHSMLDTTFPAYTPKANMRDTSYDIAKTHVSDKVKARRDYFADLASAGGSVKAREKAQEALAALKESIGNHGETKFYIGQRLETYNSRRVDLMSEAAHAALHADRILNAQPLLDHKIDTLDVDAERRVNPMLDATLDRYTLEDEAVLRKVMRLEVQRMIAEFDLEENTFGPNHDTWPADRISYKYSKEVWAQVQSLRTMANSVFNEHVCKSRSQMDPYQLGIGISQVHGWTGFLHSSLPATDDTYFHVRLDSTWEEDHFGTSQARASGSPTLEFDVTSDDLMMLLRGHPTGKEVPITFRSIFGIWKRNIEREEHTLEKEARDITQEMTQDPRTQAVFAAIADLKAHLDIAGGKKAWKEELAQKVDTLQVALDVYLGVIDDGFATGDAALRKGVGKMVKESLEEMRAALPPALMEKLLIEK